MALVQVHLPLVTIIVTAYNHEQYIGEAIDSVLNQSYAPIQIILINNGSIDLTHQKILPYLQVNAELTYIQNTDNRGLCRAFNQGLFLAKGKYIVDLSGDDVLLKNRIERQVDFFEHLPAAYGVIFSNAIYWNANGHFMKYHYEIDPQKKAIPNIPSGVIFKDILEKYFICTPTMMMRADILQALGGYDESLAFEDFDFWVRSAVLCQYQYQDEILTVKREIPHSLGKQIIDKNNALLVSSLVVCQKAYALCGHPEEFAALSNRIQTFIRKCLYCEQFPVAFRFAALHGQIKPVGIKTKLVLFLCRVKLPVNKFYRIYLKLFR